MANLIYTTTKKGRLLLRGNTLGISNDSATCCRQYGLISLDPTQSAGAGFPSCTSTTLPGCPFGTTLDWTKNGSFSDVDLAPNETIEFAFLLWGMVSVGGLADNSITFNTPLQSSSITPNPSYSLSSTDGFFNYITRGANVTTIVKDAGPGRYSVQGVPTPAPSSNVGTGWCLALIINNTSLPIKNMSIYSESAVNYPSSVSTTVSGFKSPLTGPINAKISISAQWGDPIGTGDTFLLNSVLLSGPKNPVDNFFQGQIVDENGDYYNSSMCTYNATPSSPTGTYIPYGRQVYDISTIKTSGIITPGSTTALVNVAANPSDTVIVNLLALEIDALAAILDLTKTSNKTISFPGDSIEYTVVLKNSGTDTAITLQFNDSIPANTTFIPNSFKINGVTQPDQQPFNATLPNLIVDASITVSFSVLVDSTLASPLTIVNTAYSNYSTNGYSTIETSYSNIVNTPIILQPSLSKISKTVDKFFAKQNDVLLYTIVIPNSSSVIAQNVILKDTIPSEVIFQTSSVVINGVPNPSANILSGINLGNIADNSSVTVTFLATVTIPFGVIVNSANVSFENSVFIGKSFYNESPPVITTIPNALISAIKLVDLPTIPTLTTVSYTLILKNTGNMVGNSYLLDTLPVGFNLITNSFNQDGTPIPSPGNIGVNLPNPIPPNSTSTITFNVFVSSIPAINPFNNIANIQTSYIFNPSTTPNILTSNSVNSSVASVLVNTANISITKYVDKIFATSKDTLTYTIIFENKGNIPATNIIFHDTLANDITFIPNTLRFNDIVQSGMSITSPLPLPDIGGNEILTLSFSALIN